MALLLAFAGGFLTVQAFGHPLAGTGVGWFLMLLWTVLPYLALALVAATLPRLEPRWLSEGLFLFLALAVSSMALSYGASLNHKSSTEALIFLFLPLWQLVLGGMLALISSAIVAVVRWVGRGGGEPLLCAECGRSPV